MFGIDWLICDSTGIVGGTDLLGGALVSTICSARQPEVARGVRVLNLIAELFVLPW
jgi:hypothetical protein